MARGILANVMAMATRIAVQFATLPIFFANWPTDRIGSWMILFAIPAYLSMIGNGLAGAGGSAALAAAQAGDMASARASFRTAWLLSSGATIALAAAFVVAGGSLAGSMAHGLSGIPAAEVVTSLAWLGLYIFANNQLAATEIAHRVAGRYPDYSFLITLTQLAEIAVIALCVTTNDSVTVLAAALAGTRLAAMVISFLLSRQRLPAIYAQGSAPLAPMIRRLWKPSLAFMVLPLVFAINLQGYVLLIGARYGPVLLAAFVATRTLTRLLDLLTNVAYNLQYYEAGYLGQDPRAIQRRQLATMTLVALCTAIAFSAFLLLSGHWLQRLFTLGETRFDPAIAAVLLVAATVRALAASPTAMIAADNRHSRLLLGHLAGSALSLMAAAGLSVAGMPLPIVLAALVAAELTQTLPAFRAMFRHLDLTAGAFLQSLTSRERLDDLVAITRLLRQRP